MRPMVFRSSTAAQPAFSITGAFIGSLTVPVPGAANYVSSYFNTFANKIVLQWTDGAPISTPSSFLIKRAVGAGSPVNYATITFLPGFPPIYTDTQVDPSTTYNYSVFAFNAAAGANCAAPGVVDATLGGACATPATNNPISATAPAFTNPTGVTLTASKPSPHVVGTDVQFNAAATGATAGGGLTVDYLYEFLLQTGAAAPVVVQSYSNNNGWTMPDTTPVGAYTVIVNAKTSLSATTAPAVVTASVPYAVVVSPQPPVTTASPVPATISPNRS